MHKKTLSFVGGNIHSAVGRTHVAAARMDGRWHIGPCYFSRNEELNKKSHEFYGLPWENHPKSFESWLENTHNNIDLISLLTPSDKHAEESIKVLNTDTDLLIEKPVSCSIKESETLKKELQKKPNLYCRFVHNYSAYPLYRDLILRVKQNQIGKVIHVRATMPSDAYAREKIIGKPQAWRQTDPEIPMLLLDLGTHLHHLVTLAIGHSKAKISARMHKLVNTSNVIDNAEIWEEREDGIKVSYWLSKSHLGKKNGLEIEIFGTKGALRWYQMEPDQLIHTDENSNQNIINRGSIDNSLTYHDRFKPGHPTGFVEAFANFYNDLADDYANFHLNKPQCEWIHTINEAFNGIRFLDAATRSSKSKEWIEI